MTQLTVTLSNTAAKLLLPVPVTLCYSGPEFLVPERRMLPQRGTIMPLNWKLRQPAGHLRLLMPLNQEAWKGFMVLAGGISPDHQREMDCYFITEVGKSMSGTQAIP